uniref:Ig-like domain-containing protein n=1 Tax=Loa loa TaxID=7209 RepID=A0A1I7W5R6_LOALO
MYGAYYLGIVLEVFDGRIKVLRKNKIYQFSCEITTNIVPGSWINFSIQTVAATPCRSNDSDSTFEQYVWSPHFEWVLDNDGIFNNENVMPNIVYVIWIELLDESSLLNNDVLMKVTEIVRPAYDQLPIYDAPWNESEMPADAGLLSVHCLQNRPKNKINPAAIYSGLVVWRDMECRRIALWSVATGLVYFRHQQCQNIAIGAWLDFVVRIRHGGVLEAHKLKYSEIQMVPTREFEGKAQICQKMKIPENSPEKDWIWESDVVGKVLVDSEQFKNSVMDQWDDLAGSIAYVWISCDQFNSTVRWKFHSFVQPNEYTETEEDAENIERFADLVIL